MQTLYKVSAVLIALVLLLIAVFSCYAFFNEGKLVSESENRTLAQLPRFSFDLWFSGRFSMQLGRYLSEHVLLREELIPVTRALERWMRVGSKIRIIDITKPN